MVYQIAMEPPSRNKISLENPIKGICDGCHVDKLLIVTIFDKSFCLKCALKRGYYPKDGNMVKPDQIHSISVGNDFCEFCKKRRYLVIRVGEHNYCYQCAVKLGYRKPAPVLARRTMESLQEYSPYSPRYVPSWNKESRRQSNINNGPFDPIAPQEKEIENIIPAIKDIDRDRLWRRGKAFEGYVRLLFGSEFELINWTKDDWVSINKSEIKEPINETEKYPDLFIKHIPSQKRFLFEVKFKSMINFDWKNSIHFSALFTDYQKKRYEKYSESLKAPCFIVVGTGVGGTKPSQIWLIPLSVFASEGFTNMTMDKFQREPNRSIIIEDLCDDYINTNELIR